MISLYGTYLGVNCNMGNPSALALPVVVILLALIPVLLPLLVPCEKLGRLGKRLYFCVRLLFLCGMAGYILSFGAFCVYVFDYLPADGEKAVDAMAEADETGAGLTVVVFGCRTYETPGETLTRRLDTACELLTRYPRAMCVLSGGQGSNEPKTEARSMYEYLVGRGIDPERLRLEEESHTTIENIEKTLELAEKDEALQGRTLICVSSSFHMRRIGMLLENFGEYDYLLEGAPEGNAFSFTANLVREYMAYVKMFIFHL